jgi:hypothetical protein
LSNKIKLQFHLISHRHTASVLHVSTWWEILEMSLFL